MTNAIVEHSETHQVTGATGLELLEIGAGRIHVDDKKIINCRADLNQLVPFKLFQLYNVLAFGISVHALPVFFCHFRIVPFEFIRVNAPKLLFSQTS